MSDITIAVASSLAALAMSMVLTGRVAIEVVRTLSYCAMVAFGAHVLGVTVIAPISSQLADALGIGAFVWLVVALLAVCSRGLRRSISGKQRPLIVR